MHTPTQPPGLPLWHESSLRTASKAIHPRRWGGGVSWHRVAVRARTSVAIFNRFYEGCMEPSRRRRTKTLRKLQPGWVINGAGRVWERLKYREDTEKSLTWVLAIDSICVAMLWTWAVVVLGDTYPKKTGRGARWGVGIASWKSGRSGRYGDLTLSICDKHPRNRRNQPLFLDVREERSTITGEKWQSARLNVLEWKSLGLNLCPIF